MKFIAFALLLASAVLATPTGPPKPKRSVTSCDFYSCPTQDIAGDYLTGVGSDHGTGDISCSYDVNPTDANSCYYDPTTGMQEPRPRVGDFYPGCPTSTTQCVPTEVCGVAWTCPIYDGAAATVVGEDDSDADGSSGPYYKVIIECGYNGPLMYPICFYDSISGMFLGGDLICPLRAGCTDVITRRELEHRKRVAAEEARRDALPFPGDIEDAHQPW